MKSPNSAPLRTRERVEDALNEGFIENARAAFTRGDVNEAISYLKFILLEYPEHQEALRLLLKYYAHYLERRASKIKKSRLKILREEILECCRHLHPDPPIKHSLTKKEAAILRSNVPELFSSTTTIDWTDIHTLTKIFNGRDGASLEAALDAAEQLAQELPPSYDEVWPLIELMEQIANKMSDQTQELFVKRYAKLCTNTKNDALKAGLAWGINEFLERGPLKNTGIQIGLLLAKSKSKTILRVLHVLTLLRPELSSEFKRNHISLPAKDEEVSSIEETAQRAMDRIQQAEKGELFSRDPFAFYFPEFKDLILFWKAEFSGGGLGVVAMGYSKEILRHLMKALKPDKKTMELLCTEFLKRIDNTASYSCFLAIEAMEKIRELSPNHFSVIAANYLGKVKRRSLAFGLGVCICEGYEEGGTDNAMGRLRFALGKHGWEVKTISPDLPKQGLDSFFRTAAVNINQRPEFDELAPWINHRLDLHPSQTLSIV